MGILNSHEKTNRDVRNADAIVHEECPELMILKTVIRTTSAGVYEEADVICRNCKVQYKAFNWRE